MEDRDSAMECSELDIDFIDVEKDEESVNVIFRFNEDISVMIVGFKGANITGLWRM